MSRQWKRERDRWGGIKKKIGAGSKLFFLAPLPAFLFKSFSSSSSWLTDWLRERESFSWYWNIVEETEGLHHNTVLKNCSPMETTRKGLTLRRPVTYSFPLSLSFQELLLFICYFSLPFYTFPRTFTSAFAATWTVLTLYVVMLHFYPDTDNVHGLEVKKIFVHNASGPWKTSVRRIWRTF